MKASMGSIPISWMTTSNKEIQPWIRRFANSASRILGLGHVSVPSSTPYLSFLFGLIQRTGEVQSAAGPAKNMTLLIQEYFHWLKAPVPAIPLLAGPTFWVKRHNRGFTPQQTPKVISVLSLWACNPSYSSEFNRDAFIIGYCYA